ncbi:MAG: LysM peptidoglycan-binding domain-containing protein, partial [candidate division Zixibacteria bacterium]|nr:LysM peptidoglycan-binding domain-containing protein [candidate division Zixibacteria bacterium]
TATIRALNGLGRSSRIYPGQILEIRGSSDYISHRIKRGETLSTIARKYSTSIAKIMAHNNIDNPHQISIGSRLRIYTR